MEFSAGSSGRAAREDFGVESSAGTSGRGALNEFGVEFSAGSSGRAARNGFGLADPASMRRWEAEAQLIRLAELDRRDNRRRRTVWIAIVLFLLADIAVAGGLILGQL
ncbi:MAG: hypothetical protein M3Y89_16570 [Actinomycetota bacterium]|nr:hypothetical protein [Actinomycetota bacterium]